MTAYNLDKVERLRKLVSSITPVKRKADLGQYFTSAPIARFMASLFSSEMPNVITLLDAGAGNGMLTAAFLDRWIEQSSFADSIRVSAYEIDPDMRNHLKQVLNSYSLRASESDRDIEARVYGVDFVEAASRHLLDDSFEGFTHAILNPPYKKINSLSPHKKLLLEVGIDTVNLYSAFVALTVLLLKPHGELVAIIPRSFCNGPYYRPFRKLLLSQTTIHHIHLFGSRDKAFSGDGVLQENVIIHVVKAGQAPAISLSTSADGDFSDYLSREVTLDEVVKPHDPEAVIHIPTGQSSEQELLAKAEYTLGDLDVQVSTGPVVEFRLKEHLRESLVDGAAPLLYPGHFVNLRLQYPLASGKKPNAIMINPDTEKWFYPSGYYTVVRRFSSKEERKRIVASVLLPSDLPSGVIGFENHLNVFHRRRGGLTRDLAYGLAGFLNSTLIDTYFRDFSGHTQVNASDLRFLPYPSLQILAQLGQELQMLSTPDQETIDSIVAAYL